MIVVGHAGHDGRVLETVLLIARALALACRGHHELVLEHIALRQQLHALRRTVRRRALRGAPGADAGRDTTPVGPPKTALVISRPADATVVRID